MTRSGSSMKKKLEFNNQNIILNNNERSLLEKQKNRKFVDGKVWMLKNPGKWCITLSNEQSNAESYTDNDDDNDDV